MKAEYVVLAEALKAAMPTPEKFDEGKFAPAMYAWCDVVESVSQAFAEYDEQFDAPEFMDACDVATRRP